MAEFTGTPSQIVLNRSFEGQHGTIYYFDIEFENGDSGQFSTNKENQTKFTVGKEVKYVMTDEVDKRGKAYTKIDIAKEAFKGGQGGYRGGNTNKGSKSPEAEASILASVCLDMANIVADKMSLQENINEDLKALHALANKFYKHIVEKSGSDVQKRINYQSRLKEVCNHFFDYPNLKISNSDDILRFVDTEVEFLQSKMKP